MIVYNITFKTDPQIAANWLLWCQQEFIPEMMATGCFSRYRLLKMLEVDHSEGPTYTLQFNAESKARYNIFVEKHRDEFQRNIFQKWGNAFVSFHSVMQVINQCE